MPSDPQTTKSFEQEKYDEGFSDGVEAALRHIAFQFNETIASKSRFADLMKEMGNAEY